MQQQVRKLLQEQVQEQQLVLAQEQVHRRAFGHKQSRKGQAGQQQEQRVSLYFLK
jgi:hypothetical protein